MVEQVSILAIVSLLAACLGALVAVRIQSRYWKNIHAQHEGWEHAQGGHHRSWEKRQEKLIAGIEARFTAQLQQLHNDWLQWEVKDAERIIAGIRQQELSEELSRKKHELARLPRVEETSMVLNSKYPEGQAVTHGRPALLQGADLTDHDLSHHYLGRADMRNAQLARTNFFMADLSGACLADADLSEADLSGANLSNADLRGALLTGANLQVADLNNAILTGANLQGARNLTTQQVYTTIYDSTTQLDADIDITLPRTSSMRSTHHIGHDFPSTPPDTEVPSQDATPLVVEAKPVVEILSAETAPPVVVVEPLLEQTISPETSQSAATHEETSLPQQEAEPTPTLPTAPDEKKLSQEEIQLLVDRREAKHTEEPGKTPHRSKYNGRKRARVG